MDFEKLAPWNWFKKEEESRGEVVPIRKGEESSIFPVSLHELESKFENLFDSLKSGFSSDSFFKMDLFKPSLDVAADGKEYSIKIELPGIDKSNISIEYTDKLLKIKGQKHQEKEEKEKDYYRIERSYGSFERVLNIPDDADIQNITSSYKDGVLSISIPRKALPKAETRTIEIKSDS